MVKRLVIKQQQQKKNNTTKHCCAITTQTHTCTFCYFLAVRCIITTCITKSGVGCIDSQSIGGEETHLLSI